MLHDSLRGRELQAEIAERCRQVIAFRQLFHQSVQSPGTLIDPESSDVTRLLAGLQTAG